MDKATVIATLKRHEAELRELGIERLSIFGSIARDEATEASDEASDVDFAALLAPGPRGFARLERIDRIKGRLSKILRRRVDLIEEPSPSPRVQQEIDRDRVLAF
jgi:predicted nucleotidyltransferase